VAFLGFFWALKKQTRGSEEASTVARQSVPKGLKTPLATAHGKTASNRSLKGQNSLHGL